MTAQTPRLRIGEIRDIIRSCDFRREWLSGGTSDEFVRQNVGPALQEKIDELRALVIPPRFAEDIRQRDRAIASAERCIARWNDARAEAAKPKAEQVHKHIWLGGPVCVICGTPFVAGNGSAH
jgi:hypothetical protein